MRELCVLRNLNTFISCFIVFCCNSTSFIIHTPNDAKLKYWEVKRRLKYVLNKGYNYYVVCDILKSVTTFAGRNGDYHRYTHVVLTSYAIVGYDETTNTIFSEPLLFPHRHHHLCPVCALLHHLLCPDGTAHFYCSKGCVVVRVLRFGKDLPVRRVDHPRSRWSEAHKFMVEK